MDEINEAIIENGMAKLSAGTYLAGLGQPVACNGTFTEKALRGFIVPDRADVRVINSAATKLFFATAERPFLTRLEALPDKPLKLVSSKLLVAPFNSRTSAQTLKLVPMSFNKATPITEFTGGKDGLWVIAATQSRTNKIVLEDGETMLVRPEALVAWIGKNPTGFCPKLSILDILLPRGPKNLAYTFHGPAIIWFEGGEYRNLKQLPKFRN